jgi:hypothetical protein
MLMLPRTASATVLVAADLGELVASARNIVHGRVVDTTSQWLDGRRGIETIVTLAVEDALKGPAARSITFRVPGGQMGPYRSFLPGVPTFSEGDDVIVFLAGEGPAIPHIVGFSQGVYRVSSGGESPTVRPGVPGPVSGSNAKVARGTGSRVAPLEAFETQVRALVRGQPAAYGAARLEHGRQR